MSTPAWFRMNATAKSGSMPELHPAMIEMVPVGATVVTLQLRSFRIGRIRSPLGPRAQLSSGPQMLRSHSGKTPRMVARRSDSRFASSSMNAWIRRPRSTASSESYGTPIMMKASARPMMPSPMRRIRCARSVICGSGYAFASMTFSRKCVVRCTTPRRPSQSIWPSLTNTPTLIEPRLQTSYGRRGCSPHGFVAS